MLFFSFFPDNSLSGESSSEAVVFAGSSYPIQELKNQHQHHHPQALSTQKSLLRKKIFFVFIHCPDYPSFSVGTTGASGIKSCPVRYPAGFLENVQSGPVSSRISGKCPVRYPAGFLENVRSGIRQDFWKMSGSVSSRISGKCPVRYPTGFLENVRSGIQPDSWKMSSPVSSRITGNCSVRYPA